jgi:hypothetical protein
MQLDDLVMQLKQVHGAELVGVVLYGSAASDEQVAGRSDQNVLVIVDTLDMRTLQSLAQTARAWQEAGNPPPLLLTRREWIGSADVFPMEYGDILERHRVLAGALPLEGIRVHLADLRLQVEQEALGKLLRLRRAVMTAGADTTRQRELLQASLSAMLVIFRSVLRLHGEPPSRDAASVILRAAALCGFDAAPFTRAHQLRRGAAVNDNDIAMLLGAYVQGTEQLVNYLDRYTPSPDASGTVL